MCVIAGMHVYASLQYLLVELISVNLPADCRAFNALGYLKFWAPSGGPKDGLSKLWAGRAGDACTGTYVKNGQSKPCPS